MDHDRYIKEMFPVALKFRTDWTFQQRHPFMQNQRNGVRLHCLLLHRQRSLAPYSPVLNAVMFKTMLINELNRAVRQVSPDVVFVSCSSWTNRFYQRQRKLVKISKKTTKALL